MDVLILHNRAELGFVILYPFTLQFSLITLIKKRFDL